MHLAHPFSVAAGEVIVYGNDMHALARKGVEVCGQSGNERFAFTRAHLCNTTLVQADTAHYLHVEVLHFEHAPTCFAQGGECVEHYVVEGLARGEPLF